MSGFIAVLNPNSLEFALPDIVVGFKPHPVWALFQLNSEGKKEPGFHNGHRQSASDPSTLFTWDQMCAAYRPGETAPALALSHVNTIWAGASFINVIDLDKYKEGFDAALGERIESGNTFISESASGKGSHIWSWTTHAELQRTPKSLQKTGIDYLKTYAVLSGRAIKNVPVLGIQLTEAELSFLRGEVEHESRQTSQALLGADGQMSPVAAANAQLALEPLLLEAGFTPAEGGTRWASPSMGTTAGGFIVPSRNGSHDIFVTYNETALDWMKQGKSGRVADAAHLWVHIQTTQNDPATGKPRAASYSQAIYQLSRVVKAVDETGAVIEVAGQYGELTPITVNDYNERQKVAAEKAVVQLQIASGIPEFEGSFNTGNEETATVEHFINPWLPKHSVVGFYGRGGSGKSSMVNTLCARVSDVASTLWISSEEHDTNIRARYTKSGGAIGTMKVLTAHPKLVATGEHKAFDIYTHLERAIIDTQQQVHTPLGIVVIDALVALVAWKKGESANDDKSIKDLLAFLHGLSERLGVTIIPIGHMNKNTSKAHGADAVTGSAALTNSLRFAFMCYQDKNSQQEYEYIIRVAKNNMGGDFAATYRTVPVHTVKAEEVDEHGDIIPGLYLCKTEFVGKVAWGSRAVEDMLFDSEDENPNAKGKATRKEKSEWPAPMG